MRTVLIVGNGAVRNGWEPLSRAVARVVGSPIQFNTNPAETISYLIFQLRDLSIGTRNPKRRAAFRRAYSVRSRLLETIREEFSLAIREQRISLDIPKNAEFSELINSPETSIITTNWDTLLQSRFGSTHPVVCLHGCIDSPKTLYLPTEIRREHYRKLEKSEAVAIDRAHDHAADLLRQAERVVLWGVSLSIYDAELAVMLAESARGTGTRRRKHYVIINPCKLPAKKLMFLTGTSPRHIQPFGTRCDRDCCRTAASLDKKAV